MAKAAELDIDLAAPAHQPPAATSPRKTKEQGREAAHQVRNSSNRPRHLQSKPFGLVPEGFSFVDKGLFSQSVTRLMVPRKSGH